MSTANITLGFFLFAIALVVWTAQYAIVYDELSIKGGINTKTKFWIAVIPFPLCIFVLVVVVLAIYPHVFVKHAIEYYKTVLSKRGGAK